MNLLRMKTMLIATALTLAAACEVDDADESARGNFIWIKQAGMSGDDSPVKVAALPGDSFVVTGHFVASAVFGEGETNETTLVSAGDKDVFLAKYDVNGGLLWAKRAGGLSDVTVHSLSATANGAIMIGGTFKNVAIFGEGEPNETSLTATSNTASFAALYSPDGQLSWAKSIPSQGSLATDFSANSDGSFVVCGELCHTTTFGEGEAKEISLAPLNIFDNCDHYVAKYKSDATLDWARQAINNGRYYSWGIKCQALINGDVKMIGGFSGEIVWGQGEEKETTLLSDENCGIYLTHLRADGTLEWAKTAANNGKPKFEMTVLDDGTAIIYGYSPSSMPDLVFGQGELNVTYLEPGPFLATYKPDGMLDWAVRAAQGSNYRMGVGGMSVSDAHSTIITGSFGTWEGGAMFFDTGGENSTKLKPSNGREDLFTAAVDKAGNIIWVRQYGGPEYDQGIDTAILADGSAIVVGTFEDTAMFGKGEQNETSLRSRGGKDIFILKLAL